MTKRTLILGASFNPSRFSYQAAEMLSEHKIPACGIGIKAGNLHGIPIHSVPDFPGPFHTVTLYLSPVNQAAYYEYVLGLKPERIIFNPGTENDEFEIRAMDAGIQVIRNCTLVMLRNNLY